mmetsp:Transcript_17381/g.31186  ORF Transcript_17381/g.31186 Transcript_17381/m.31186 type:complete len:368 (-) Transcript_17381:54-1157(-)
MCSIENDEHTSLTRVDEGVSMKQNDENKHEKNENKSNKSNGVTTPASSTSRYKAVLKKPKFFQAASQPNLYARELKRVKDNPHRSENKFIKGKKIERRKTILVTGHSLGGAMATLAALDLQTRYNQEYKVRMINVASPRVGDFSFEKIFCSHVPDSLRLVMDKDIVPDVPKFFCMFKHCGHELFLDAKGNGLVDRTPVEKLFIRGKNTDFGSHFLPVYQGAVKSHVRRWEGGDELVGDIEKLFCRRKKNGLPIIEDNDTECDKKRKETNFARATCITAMHNLNQVNPLRTPSGVRNIGEESKSKGSKKEESKGVKDAHAATVGGCSASALGGGKLDDVSQKPVEAKDGSGVEGAPEGEGEKDALNPT